MLGLVAMILLGGNSSRKWTHQLTWELCRSVVDSVAVIFLEIDKPGSLRSAVLNSRAQGAGLLLGSCQHPARFGGITTKLIDLNGSGPRIGAAKL